MKKILAVIIMVAMAQAASAISWDLWPTTATPAGDGGSTTINQAIFSTDTTQTAGTGVIQPFVRIQANGTEHGVNTSIGTPWDTKGGIFTHDLRLDALEVFNSGGTDYFRFILDINQSANNALLSLNEVRLYQTATAFTDLTALQSMVMASSPATLVYDMDAGGDNTLNLDYNLSSSGGGAADMALLIPTSLFDLAAANANDYVYLYSAFGSPSPANAGGEEWSIRDGIHPTFPSAPIPDGGMTLILLGMGTMILSGFRRVVRM